MVHRETEGDVAAPVMADHGELLVPRAAHQGEDVTRPLRAWSSRCSMGEASGLALTEMRLAQPFGYRRKHRQCEAHRPPKQERMGRVGGASDGGGRHKTLAAVAGGQGRDFVVR